MKKIELKIATYSLSELAKATGIYVTRIHEMIDAGFIEVPDVRHGQWLKYSEELYVKTVKELRDHPLLSKVQMAKHLGVTYSEFATAVRGGHVPEPDVLLVKRMHYRDLKKIEKAWKAYLEKPAETRTQKREKDGWFSMASVARLCDVASSTIQHHIRFHTLQNPTHRVSGSAGCFYTKKEKDAIVRFIEQRRKQHPFMTSAKKVKGKQRSVKKK